MQYGWTVGDKYKRNKLKIPTMGGLAILSGMIGSVVFIQVLLPQITQKLLIFSFVVFSFAVFGFLDDLINLSKKIRIVAPFFLALPIALLVKDTNMWVGFTSLELNLFYSFLVAPVYVMVCSNLINMHSGFNGLSGGLSWILLFFIGLKAHLIHNNLSLVYFIPIFLALSAFMIFNKYPSRIFLGDTGTLMLGAAIGSFLIMNNLEIFGIIILFPHIINFLLWLYWCFNMGKHPHIKFGKLRKDNTLKVPNALTVKYAVCYFFRLTELQATLILYGITTLFCVVGLVLV